MARSNGALLMLATFGMEIVECGGAIAKHVRAGGDAYAVVAFSRPESRPQVEAAAKVLGVKETRFLGIDSGDITPGAASKLPFVSLIREWQPSVAIMQDPVHAFGDLDPGRRDVIDLYMEAIAHAGRDWRIAEAGGRPAHHVDSIYYMTPTTANCVLDVADVWELKERAMDELHSQMAFSGAHHKRRLGPAARILVPDADLAGDDEAFGRAVHKVTDLAYHVNVATHSHSGLALAEAYRREGPFVLDKLP